MMLSSLILALVGITEASCSASLVKESRVDRLRVALVQYEISRPRDLLEWEKKLHHIIVEAAEKRSQLILLPELISIEGIALVDPKGVDQARAIREVARLYTPHFRERFSSWARQYEVTIVGSSWPELQPDGKLYNSALIFYPDGGIFRQSKNHLTHDEKELYRMDGAVEYVPLRIAKDIDAAIAICFDSEFPNFLPVSEGIIPELILVPSMTGAEEGRHRVLRSASARAIEYHAYVLVTGTVGGDPKDPILGGHSGQAVALSPSDTLFPADGILAKGSHKTPEILIVDLDFARLRKSRDQSTTFPAKILREGKLRTALN